MSVAPMDISPELKRAGRRFGYMVAVVINVAGLIIVQNILEWGWLPFLTDDFADLVPWISLSLIVSIVGNTSYQINDKTFLKSTGQILVNLVSVIVTYQVWQVFPFDFSGYQFDWDLVTRLVLILAMVGAGIGAVVEMVRLVSNRRDAERAYRN